MYTIGLGLYNNVYTNIYIYASKSKYPLLMGYRPIFAVIFILVRINNYC